MDKPSRMPFFRARTLLGWDDMRPQHDLHRTGATNLTSERPGFPRFVASKVLIQMSDTGGTAAVTAIYDRNEYLRENAVHYTVGQTDYWKS
jgi:hypothetical protein